MEAPGALKCGWVLTLHSTAHGCFNSTVGGKTNSARRSQPLLRSAVGIAKTIGCRPLSGRSQRREPLLDRAASAVKGGEIRMKLESPVCAQEERMDLEGELGRVGIGSEMSRLLCLSHRDLKGADPLFHQSGKPVANRPGMTVELRCGRGKETPAAKHFAACVVQP